MAQPWVTTVTIDDVKFNAMHVGVGLTTVSGLVGRPTMGSLHMSIDISVDIHDTKNMPFADLKKLFNLAKLVTKDKVKDIKIEYWTDDLHQDAICVFTFQGWISHFQVLSGEGGNHTLALSLQPTLTPDNFTDIDMSN